jgi:REP element-mobilizing transposase RayT
MEGAAPSAPQKMNSRPKRKHPAHHPVADEGNLSPIIFLTVCTQDRKRILAHADIHELLRSAWIKASHWSVGRYIIMPDHLHLFCSPATRPPTSMRVWMKYWKSLASRAWPRPQEQPVWQQDGWDTQLRKGEHYSEKWMYVRHNPVRGGLVMSPDEWPFQGEMNVLMWHER